MHQNPDVVVVGAGPVGLVAACELIRRGVRVRIIDKLAQPTAESRAIAVHARSLDMFERMGIVDDLLATGVKSTGMNLVADGKTLVRVPLDSIDSAFPYALITAQTETERVLAEHLSALGGSIERGVELTAMTRDDDTVHLTLQRADGTTETVTASWVVGADGGHSTVRRLVNTRLKGSFEGERFILGDVDADHQLGNTNMFTFFSAAGPVLTLPMRGGRVRFLAQIHDAPGTPINTHPTQDELQNILDERVGDITITNSHWLTCFEVHHGQVPTYRFGRVFLAGDAAHIHSPAGGQGMNTGMQDAFNLAWKLAMVIHGDAGDALLDSYDAERHPVGKKVIDFTSALTKAGTLKGGARRVRDVAVQVVGKVRPVLHMMAGNVAESTVAYDSSPAVLKTTVRGAKITAGGHLPHIKDAELAKHLARVCGPDNTGHTLLTITAGKAAPAAGPAGQVQVLICSDDTPAGGYDAVIADPDGLVAKRYGLKDGGRVVVRPDGYLGAVTTLDDQTGVADYFAQIGR